MAYVFPKFEDLPPVPNAPQGCLWGFYDRDGRKDEIGSINLLTSEVVKEASGEIQIGKHVQLDWPLDSLKFPTWGRKILEHRLLDMSETEYKSYAFDDEIAINTQAYFCDRGGIVGRGVLVDMVRYWEKIDQSPPDPWANYEITVDELEAALADQHTQTKQGDVLLVRTGYIKRHAEASSDAERQKGTQANFRSIGLAPRDDMLRWLYERHFAALVADNVSNGGSLALHDWCLVWWGTPLGELWNLEELSGVCSDLGRWTFFLTSAPLNITGGAASPPGAIAIF
ncbi:uncharacterized protein PG998_005854 [Apiospora kogelbergensis]|uniref:uncharacterized protein n=1 Tax=Apiospora kogelbergensis TaxID=1337665 RepID=UPI003130C27D